MSKRSSYRGLAITVVLVSVGCAGGHEDAPAEQTGEARSAVSYGYESSAADVLIVLIQMRNDTTSYLCSGTVVAPNLLITAKHCLYPQSEFAASSSRCGPNGEPVDDMGLLQGQPAISDLMIYVGADAKYKAFNLREPPAAVVTRIVDDGTKIRCSYDIAYVLLDRPIDTPIARLRLGKRPAPGDRISIAGWGEREGRARPAIRFRRDDILVQRVGPKEAPPDATGDLGPKIFEAGAGGCVGDSGGAAFEPATGVATGILSRGFNLDVQCKSQSAVNVYVAISDHEKILREAFDAAGAEPWLEGRDAPGYLAFGEPCLANAECKGNLCDGASVSSVGSCNVDCSAGLACPDGFVCSPRGKCEPPSSEEPPSPLTSARAPGCGVANGRDASANRWALALAAMSVCRFARRRSRMRSRAFGRSPCP